MAYEHLDTIQTKARSLSALTSGAAAFLTSNILNIATREFIDDISPEEYIAYMAYLGTEAYDPSKLHYEMSADEIKYDALVSAETYLALSYLAAALKKVDKNSVLFDREEFGDSNIYPSMFDDIIKMANIWKGLYRKSLDQSGADANPDYEDSGNGYIYLEI